MNSVLLGQLGKIILDAHAISQGWQPAHVPCALNFDGIYEIGGRLVVAEIALGGVIEKPGKLKAGPGRKMATDVLRLGTAHAWLPNQPIVKRVLFVRPDVLGPLKNSYAWVFTSAKVLGVSIEAIPLAGNESAITAALSQAAKEMSKQDDDAA